MKLFWSLVIFIMVQRLIELRVAKRNEERIIAKGGYEVGMEHYKFIVYLHILFFISLLTEVGYFGKELSSWWYLPFILFLFAQVLRIWCLVSLGEFWNTRIMILPGARVVKKGPYRYLRHPNYTIVALEILVIPLIFQAYITAILFSILNAIVLSIRIPFEERALREVTNYEEEFKGKLRFIPKSNE